jgi:hypothetical protein
MKPYAQIAYEAFREAVKHAHPLPAWEDATPYAREPWVRVALALAWAWFEDAPGEAPKTPDRTFS